MDGSQDRLRAHHAHPVRPLICFLFLFCLILLTSRPVVSTRAVFTPRGLEFSPLPPPSAIHHDTTPASAPAQAPAPFATPGRSALIRHAAAAAAAAAAATANGGLGNSVYTGLRACVRSAGVVLQQAPGEAVSHEGGKPPLPTLST
jgi:hypothetical protein